MLARPRAALPRRPATAAGRPGQPARGRRGPDGLSSDPVPSRRHQHRGRPPVRPSCRWRQPPPRRSGAARSAPVRAWAALCGRPRNCARGRAWAVRLGTAAGVPFSAGAVPVPSPPPPRQPPRSSLSGYPRLSSPSEEGGTRNREQGGDLLVPPSLSLVPQGGEVRKGWVTPFGRVPIPPAGPRRQRRGGRSIRVRWCASRFSDCRPLWLAASPVERP